MRVIDYVLFGIILLLLMLSAIFSAADMAFSSLNQLRLEKKAEAGNKKAKKALALAKDYDQTITTILFGNDFVNILASSFMAIAGVNFFLGVTDVENPELASLLASLSLLVVLLMFGEIFPKALSKAKAESVAMHLAGFIRICTFIFYPFVIPSNKLAKAMAHPIVGKNKESKLASDDELEAMVDEIVEDDLIDEDQGELLHKTIVFKETSCYEIMTPRVKMFGYDILDSFEEFLRRDDIFVHSRIIVYKKDMDHILGYIPVKTLLRELVQGNKVSAERLTLPIVSVPRTMMISGAMALMKKTRHHIAIVKDEYGGTEGLITMEDILEEVVGEMWDEEDAPKLDIAPTEKRNVYVVQGSMNIDDFFEYFEMDPDVLEDQYATVSGWLSSIVDRFPEKGETIKIDPFEIKVTKTGEFAVLECLVHYFPKRKRKAES